MNNVVVVVMLLQARLAWQIWQTIAAPKRLSPPTMSQCVHQSCLSPNCEKTSTAILGRWCRECASVIALLGAVTDARKRKQSYRVVQ